MSNEIKNKIINFNLSLGINTKFIKDEHILGYSLNNTIYINEYINQDYEKTNKHELLHFYTNTNEFKSIKDYLFSKYKNEIDLLRKEYYLRYSGLYKKEEIDKGIIDDEIAIDLIIDNYNITLDKNRLLVGTVLFNILIKSIKEKRYLNIKIKNNINNMKLTKWEKIFVTNYYNNMPNTNNKYETIRQDIKNELNRLYNIDKEEFKIDINSPDLIREYESEIKALEQRGEDTTYIKNNKEEILKEMSNKITETLYEEYMHIVNFIKTNELYEDAFKVCMLRETLLKTYKKEKNNNETDTIVKKREKHKTIMGHMTLASDTILKTIYENVDTYENFANLYFAGLELYNKSITDKSKIKLDGVNTYGLGHWIKFEGKSSNEKEYIENAKKLSALVQGTPWCTKTLASIQLANGDFYVFVDNDNKPHIAVKMIGNTIDEVRGIKNENEQEIEDNYRNIAISFLENNKEIKNGKEWLDKEEWNKRLIRYSEEIENNTLKDEEIPQLIKDYMMNDYRSHGENTNKEKLKENLPKIKGKIAEYYNCNEDEILIRDYFGSEYKEINDQKVCPYRIIFGEANFRYSEITDLGNLSIIFGNANFTRSNLINLGNLTTIGENAYFNESKITDLGSLTNIGGDADFRDSQITSLGNLMCIGEDADFSWSMITSLGNLIYIGGYADFSNSQITNLDNLTTIDGNAKFQHSQITNLENLTTIGGNAFFYCSQIIDLGNLTYIGGYANFSNSRITDLSNLTTIEEEAFFSNSEVTNLGNLTYIGRDAFFTNSKITNFGNLEEIKGRVYFNSPELEELYHKEFLINGKRIKATKKIK